MISKISKLYLFYNIIVMPSHMHFHVLVLQILRFLQLLTHIWGNTERKTLDELIRRQTQLFKLVTWHTCDRHLEFWQVNMSDSWTTRGLRVCHRQITHFCLQWFSSYTHEILWTRGSINQLCGRRSLAVQPGLRIECRESMDLNDKEQLWAVKKEQIRK